MKYKIMKLVNSIKDFLVNLKNKIKKFIVENKKLSITVGVILLLIITANIIVICNKTKIGNTSGNLTNSGFSVVKEGWVYYLGLNESNTDGIYKIKLNGNKKEKVSSDYGLYLNKSGEFLYYLDVTDGKYNIAKMKTNGENKEIFVEDVDNAKITIVDNWIYYFKKSNFYRAKINGEEKQILSKKAIENYEVSGTWIYYSYINDGKNVIEKMKTNGEDITKIDTDSSAVFFLDRNNIYYIYEHYNENEYEPVFELYKVKTNGKDKEKISDIGKNVYLENVNFDGDKIYYAKLNENNVLAIYSLTKNGKEESKIVDIQGNSTIINIHDGWIYYTDINDNGDSQLFRIKTNGKNKQSL